MLYENIKKRDGRRSLDIKDVHSNMVGLSPARLSAPEKPVMRSHRMRLKMPRALMVPNTPLAVKELIELFENKSPIDGDGDGWVDDGLPTMRPTPIGTKVVGDLTYGGQYNKKDKAIQIVKDGHGDEYVVLPDAGNFHAVAMPDDPADFWNDVAVEDAATRVEAVKLLDAVTRQKRKPGTKTVNGSKSATPSKINIPKGSSTDKQKQAAETQAQQAAKKTTPAKKPIKKATPAKKAVAAKKTTPAKKPIKKASAAARASVAAKKSAPAKKAAAKPKKEKVTPLWQRPWKSLTADEKKSRIALQGKTPVVGTMNSILKKPWTAKMIKDYREGRDLDKVIAGLKKDGWRHVTDQEERHQISIDAGKPMMPGWSHVFKYEGKKPLKNKIVGLDWAHRRQTFQVGDARADSLKGKFSRYRELLPKMPAFERKIKKELETSDVALVTRVVQLTGGRVDTKDGKSVTGSRGITSLLAKDIKIKGNKITIEYPGKSGVVNHYEFTDAAIARRIEGMMDGKKPGDQVWPDVKSTQTIRYIKDHFGEDVINHDLRTAMANATAMKALNEYVKQFGTPNNDPTAIEMLVKSVSESVGKQINDNPGTAYGSYIDPDIFTAAGIPIELQPKRKDR